MWILVITFQGFFFKLCDFTFYTLSDEFQLYDIRAMKELESFRGHRKDVTG